MRTKVCPHPVGAHENKTVTVIPGAGTISAVRGGWEAKKTTPRSEKYSVFPDWSPLGILLSRPKLTMWNLGSQVSYNCKFKVHRLWIETLRGRSLNKIMGTPLPGLGSLKIWFLLTHVCCSVLAVIHCCVASLVTRIVRNPPAMQETQIQSPGEGNCYPLQYSCLKNSMDRGAWRATVHRVAESWVQWRDQRFHFSVWLSPTQVGVNRHVY